MLNSNVELKCSIEIVNFPILIVFEIMSVLIASIDHFDLVLSELLFSLDIYEAGKGSIILNNLLTVLICLSAAYSVSASSGQFV